MATKVMDIDTIVPVLKLLGDKTRLMILKLIQQKECCVCELVSVLNMSQPAISQHLRRLRDANLVNEERRGKWVYYELNKESNEYPFIDQILKQIPVPYELLKKIDNITIC
ncbi:MAG TPA: metalloregulator ArsR/SmtB family transcription factor [Cerasibacillus sp.]|uniref:ArsR/SmtB family transcription factor n=1 Tax=Cerasibacillus sp. TaxID=2498711 RepID=UPI002F409695